MSWKMVKIPDVLFFIEGPGVRNTQFANFGVKLLNVGNINNGLLNLDATTKYISEKEAYGKYKHFLVEEGDLLIASSGIVVDNFHNKITWAKAEDLPLCMNTSTIRFKTLDSNILDIRYFSYFLKTQLFTDQLRKLITGSAQLNFGPSHLKQISLPLPPLPVQKRIAEILDAADALRRKDQELLKKYDELAQAIFIDMFGDPVRNEKGWEVKKLIDIALSGNDVKCGPFGTQLNKGEYQKAGIPIWGIPQINSNFIKGPTEYLTKKKAMELKEYSVEEDDIVMSRKGNVGACALFPKHLNSGVLHSDAIRIRVNKNIILPEVLLWQFKKSRVLQTQVANVSSGAIMAGINVTKLKQISVYVPHVNVQNKFASELELVENLKEKQIVSIFNNNNLFQTLLQKAFKGELVP